MENNKITIKRKSKFKKYKDKFGVVLANTLAFTFMLNKSVFADIDSGEVTNAVGKVITGLSSLLYIGAILMGIYGVYAYSKANREQDPHAKSKAMGFIEGALGIGLSGYLLSSVLKPLISNLFS
ncbi:hypothetical protein [Parvimonas parva]|uniref:Uncharacterized protein n=1 Tax=Parvimonas parva TaxID=2769485 RepID=A0ABS1CB02_9FIRM|nr:hypothetical protein [Parvimonas parva]MBK1469216.1 hypothetical protein [Parvimonas parva]